MATAEYFGRAANFGAIAPGERVGWYAVTLDTPWGPIEFAARGDEPSELATCAPPKP